MTTQLENCAPAAGIDRADLILKAFDGPGKLTLAQITRRTGVPRSSAHRMLERLVQLRWLRRDGQHYQLGLRLFELGTLVVQQDQLHGVALPHLRELQRLTGLTVHLAVLDRSDVVYLERLEGKFGADVDTRPGGRRRAASTSLGKVLLANAACQPTSFLSPAAEALRPNADGIRIRQEYAAIRLRGIAFDREESIPRTRCIGAPVGVKGDVVAAISVCGGVDHLAMDSKTASLVRHTGAQIYGRLGRRRAAI
ncbi:IclR family transcriptional regulator [Mycolicibacterium sp. CH28]|uniref:IclR family transcriptional regulator n=1 Tax=Mycolicibacterium sp. CH28 TaxID=2512237 RepID=UPI0010807A75|nr:IclR family transcriptional regulator [Mycolicibacterium sp. CH28]TGD87076.1 IclR family transcriptional regulator [Mycolicibacterium sp. CH28]